MSYINDTEYAAKNLIELAMREERRIDEIRSSLEEAESKFKRCQWDFETSDLHEDFSDRYVMAAFHRMAQANQQADALRSEIDSLRASIGAKQQAVQSICGALLQIAKQGISLVHRSRSAAPAGRMIGSSAIRDVIWEARNQAIHYEEGGFNRPVIDLFTSLEQSFGPEFSLSAHQHMSRATQVVRLLEWSRYDQYKSDLQSLGL